MKYLRLKIVGGVLAAIAAFFTVINVIPAKKVVDDNPFIKTTNTPMVAAHRGGAIRNPENTLKAYKAAINTYNVDVVESDLWLTKDQKLVYSHDGYIDRMSDIQLFDPTTDKHYIKDYTLDELKNYNFGYGFKDKDSQQYIYRDLVNTYDFVEDRKAKLQEAEVQILEVSELFEAFYTTKKDLLFIVEIKNGGEEGFKAADILDDLLTNTYPDYKNRVVIGTFHDEIEEYLKVEHPTLFRGASTGAAAGFVLTQYAGVNLFYKGGFQCLQIPLSYKVKGINISLSKRTIVRRAHKRNISVQYWTINTEEEMIQCIKLDCDVIMTDDPELLVSVISRSKKR